jgi:hypothetical protein
MIPAFNEDGYLPPGVHPATLEEIAVRFGQESELRRAEMDSVRWMVDLAWQAGVQRIVINGSFITDALEPNDVDCALLIGADFPANPGSFEEFRRGFPFMTMDLLDQENFDVYINEVFASDRRDIPKGMVEVIR